MKSFWKFIWDLSEFTGIGLGRFAPFVLGKMTGSKPARINRRIRPNWPAIGVLVYFLSLSALCAFLLNS